jgi:hypothetical protein
MNCEELRPDYLLYAMGTMAEPEISEMRAHLARGCPNCMEGVREAEVLAYSMGATLKGPDAPRDLRARVLAISGAAEVGPKLVQREPRRPFWAHPIASWQGLALAAAGVVLAVLPGFLMFRATMQAHDEVAAKLAQEQQSTAGLRAQISQLQADAAPHAAAIFALEFERGGAGETAKQIAIPHDASMVVLALPADLVRQASAAELRDASGKTLWTMSPLTGNEADSAGLTIPSRLLPHGRYEIVLRAGQKTVARLGFLSR